jgi:hypothetical protein
MAAEHTKREKAVINTIALIGGAIVGLAVFSWLTGSSSTYSFPSSVVGHQNVPDDPGMAAVFTLKLATDSSLFGLSFDMEDIAKHEMMEKHPEGSIIFKVVAEGDDLYGRAAEFEEFSLKYQMDDLKQVEWSNIDGPRLLNLGRITNETGSGEQLIYDYCSENQKSSEFFCDAGIRRN